jgi:hypothetical protein
MIIKIMRIKIEIQNNFIYWRVKLKRKINWTKGPKNNQKNENQNWNKKMNTNFWLKGEVEKKINSTKGPKKIIKREWGLNWKKNDKLGWNDEIKKDWS